MKPAKSLLIYLPGGMPVLRSAVEELIRSSWTESYRQRAWEITCAFEGCFRSTGHADLAILAKSLRLLLDLPPAEVRELGKALDAKFQDLLSRMEEQLGSEGEVRSA